MKYIESYIYKIASLDVIGIREITSQIILITFLHFGVAQCFVCTIAYSPDQAGVHNNVTSCFERDFYRASAY